ncbi:hypothetical protein IWX91DRAFT_18513 [Phyllosticta citricarpa]
MLTQSLTRSFVHLLTCSLAHSIAPTRLDASISSLSSPGVLSPKHHTPGQQRQQQRLINAHVFSFSASNAIHSTHSRNPKTKSILVAGVLVDWRFWFGDERLEFGVWRGGGAVAPYVSCDAFLSSLVRFRCRFSGRQQQVSREQENQKGRPINDSGPGRSLGNQLSCCK